MNENRLLEIASVISMLDGPLVVFGYLLSLSQSDMYLFLNYVKGSQYNDILFYDAIKNFSQDYIDGKEINQDNFEIRNFGYKEGNYENYFINSGFSQNYFNNYVNSDLSVNTSKSKK